MSPPSPARRRGGPPPNVGGRHAAREQAVILLYQHDVTGLSVDELVENIERERGEQINDYTRALIDGVSIDTPSLDELVTDAAEGWTADRLAPLERNILRVAVHELLDWPEVPTPVVIDEAVEMAKTYCQAEAAGFLNGILGSVARKVREKGAK